MLISRIRQFFATAKGRDVLLYLIFVVVSFAFWMILTLGNSLQSNITVRLKIEGMPKGVTLVGDCPEHIVVSVKTNGYAFLRQMLNVEPELSLDFAKYDNRNGYLIVSHQQLQEQLVRLLGQEATINSFSPDGFSSYYTKLPPKKVPVHIVGDFAAGMQYVINGDITVDEFKVSYKDADGNTQEVTTNLTTYETEREWEAAKQAAGEEGKVVGDDEVIFIEKTGEFIIGKNVADSITDNKADIQVEYTKKGFENGEAKPYYYYDCKDVTKDDPKLQVSYKKEDQSINYTTAINTVTTINTQADSVLSTDIHRDVNELVNVVQRSLDAEKKVQKLKVMMDEPQYQDEESQKMLQGYLDAATKEMDYADDNMQKTYERYITRFNGYLEDVNIAIIDVGSKQNSLSLTKVRVENQQTTIEELKSNNEDRDISDIIIDYYASYNAYTSSLTAAGKLNETNLLKFI